MGALPNVLRSEDASATHKERKHIYHSNASVLRAELKKPFEEKIEPQANLPLRGSGNDNHYQFRHTGPFQWEGILSYQSGYTQVAGIRSSKIKQPGAKPGFVTLTTSVVEGLNILDVVTADRVVARISTEHPFDGAVPSIHFLGTRFENLRIGGHKIEALTDLEIIGPKPDRDASYFDEKASKMMGNVCKQYDAIGKESNLPDWLTEKYLTDRAPRKKADETYCSLVNGVDGVKEIPKSLGVRPFGHVIDVPHFGKIYLAELTVNRKKAEDPQEDTYTFNLTMIRVDLGCPVEGGIGIAMGDPNGTGTGQGGGGTPTT
jgi:hypothetical protein